MLVKTVLALSLLPSSMYVAKVKIDIKTGVVAQKYTHKASKYFLPLKYFISLSRNSIERSHN